MVKYGQIAFLDGDVIHGGGLTPSGKRCHVYMCSPLVYDTKLNEHYREGETPTPKSDMKNHLLIPLIDRSNYNKQWVQDKINSQFDEP